MMGPMDLLLLAMFVLVLPLVVTLILFGVLWVDHAFPEGAEIKTRTPASRWGGIEMALIILLLPLAYAVLILLIS